ncbi:MAG: GTP-binding protein [Saprospiraceae bacterium]|nr:GTP-binding protein [Saprospiraceae bacterium]MBP7699719.1 GTP-binding protein [Saprospiraceae bacterium]
MIVKKVILTGSFGVGKTSLFNQFVFNKFDEKYLTTIGVKVNKKAIMVDDDEVSLLIWDIAGEVSQDKIPTSYFLGASAVIYVFDLTRPSTFKNLTKDLEYLRTLIPGVVTKMVGNKKDLLSDEAIRAIANEIPQKWDIITSAKTGENVNELFQLVGKELVQSV